MKGKLHVENHALMPKTVQEWLDLRCRVDQHNVLRTSGRHDHPEKGSLTQKRSSRQQLITFDDMVKIRGLPPGIFRGRLPMHYMA